MKIMDSLAVSAIVLASFPSVAMAQSVVTEKQLTLGLAQEIGATAIDQCRKDGFKVAVTVVNRAGQPIILMRDDGSSPHTSDVSRRKAYTALIFKSKTADLAKLIADNARPAALKDISDVIILNGGVPIRIGNEVIGAVGVSGVPNSGGDEACANAAIEKVADRLK